jgi:hypothetical protein
VAEEMLRYFVFGGTEEILRYFVIGGTLGYSGIL